MSSYLGIPYNNPTGNLLPNFPPAATVTGTRCTNMTGFFPINGAPVEGFMDLKRRHTLTTVGIVFLIILFLFALYSVYSNKSVTRSVKSLVK
jgi:hypothetical protein